MASNDIDECVHSGLSAPSEDKFIIEGKYKYYHYNCDGFNDTGWGCGYRTTQTICSWIRNKKIEQGAPQVSDVPSVLEIQKILVESGDKPKNFLGSKQWIGCFESSIVIDTLYDIPCKILHCEPNKLSSYISDIRKHFETIKTPVMMGGDLDNQSKGVLGLSIKNDKAYFLIADPHCCHRDPSIEILYKEEWVKWESINAYSNGSFYNFCLPQFK